MRFNRGANVRFHPARASVRKRLLLEARQSCRDNLTTLSSAFVLDGRSYGRGVGEGRDRGLGGTRVPPVPTGKKTKRKVWRKKRR
jgi:hypothetical protein